MYEKRVLEVYRYCNVRSFPIDCDDIIRKLGYRIVTYQSVANGDRNRLIELMQISNDAFIIRKERTMYINANADRRRQRFTKCHEIGHIVIPTNDEDEADTFASEILAPLPAIIKHTGLNCDGICRYFDVSVLMANNRIMEARNILSGKNSHEIISSSEILRYLEAVKPRTHWNRLTKHDEMMLGRRDFESYFY